MWTCARRVKSSNNSSRSLSRRLLTTTVLTINSCPGWDSRMRSWLASAGSHKKRKRKVFSDFLRRLGKKMSSSPERYKRLKLNLSLKIKSLRENSKPCDKKLNSYRSNSKILKDKWRQRQPRSSPLHSEPAELSRQLVLFSSKVKDLLLVLLVLESESLWRKVIWVPK
jgi:hypothetical protein